MKNKKDPVISVVVIGVDEGKLVSGLMNSLVGQNFNMPFEVIFVDGGSRDNTLEIVTEFKDRLDLKIVHQIGKGIGSARQQGFEKARAPIIASSDSDVILPKNWLSIIYKKLSLKVGKSVGVVGPYEMTDGRFAGKFGLYLCIVVDYISRAVTGHFHFRSMNFAILKDVWKKSGGFNIHVSALEDSELSHRIYKLGKITYLTKMVVKTTGRRFREDLVGTTYYRLGAYFYRNIFQDNSKFKEWKQIRD